MTDYRSTQSRLYRLVGEIVSHGSAIDLIARRLSLEIDSFQSEQPKGRGWSTIKNFINTEHLCDNSDYDVAEHVAAVTNHYKLRNLSAHGVTLTFENIETIADEEVILRWDDKAQRAERLYEHELVSELEIVLKARRSIGELAEILNDYEPQLHIDNLSDLLIRQTKTENEQQP
jgi:hypothetical protein